MAWQAEHDRQHTRIDRGPPVQGHPGLSGMALDGGHHRLPRVHLHSPGSGPRTGQQ